VSGMRDITSVKDFLAVGEARRAVGFSAASSCTYGRVASWRRASLWSQLTDPALFATPASRPGRTVIAEAMITVAVPMAVVIRPTAPGAAAIRPAAPGWSAMPLLCP
jgi:hypothetical protein